MWPTFIPIWAQPYGFVPSQPFVKYLWQAYVPYNFGPWPMPGVHQVPPSTLSGGASCYIYSVPILISAQWGSQLLGLKETPLIPLTSITGGKCLLLQVWHHLNTWSTLNLW